MTSFFPLILGSTGKTGRRVIQRFKAHKLPYRAGSRQENIPFDWYDEKTWLPALENISSVYIVFYPDLALPGSQNIIRRFCSLAHSSGVQQLILLSGRGEPEAQACENIVKQSGLQWSIVRCAWFAQNFSESFLQEALRQDTVYLPIGPVKEPFVDVEDIADVVFEALLHPQKHHQQCYELTGPELLRFDEAIATIAEASQRTIQYQEIPLSEYLKFLEQARIPQEMQTLLSYLFQEVLDGRNASLTQGVQEALGRPPRSFSDYVARTAQSGIWKKDKALA